MQILSSNGAREDDQRSIFSFILQTKYLLPGRGPEIEMAQFCSEIRKSDLLMNNIFSPANLGPLGEGLFSSGRGGVFGGGGRGGRHTGVQV